MLKQGLYIVLTNWLIGWFIKIVSFMTVKILKLKIDFIFVLCIS